MNTVKHTVIKIKAEPRLYKMIWLVDVVADAWGQEHEVTLPFGTKKAADEVKVGYEFEA